MLAWPWDSFSLQHRHFFEYKIKALKALFSNLERKKRKHFSLTYQSLRLRLEDPDSPPQGYMDSQLDIPPSKKWGYG
jgi:hypothetical protein